MSSRSPCPLHQPWPRLPSRPLVAVLVTAIIGCSPSPPQATDTGPDSQRYRVEFVSTWTPARFPLDYPDTSLLHRPHFSGWIGVSHDGTYRLFEDGLPASPGVEALAEHGAHAPLDEEIRNAIRSGRARSMIETEALRDFSKPLRYEIVVDRTHPRFTALSMLAPSPDWFVAVDVNLRNDAGFLPRTVVPLFVRDAGSDSGTGFFSDDNDTHPKQGIATNLRPYFLHDGAPVPVGSVTFTRL